MRDLDGIRLQPKQDDALDLILDSPAAWIGLGGGRGCAKSYGLDAIALIFCMMYPGALVCIVMRNYDQVDKYHIQEMKRNFPSLASYFRGGEHRDLRIPTGEDGVQSQIDFSYGENLEAIKRRFRSGNYWLILIDQAEQFMEDELREMKNACRVGPHPKMVLSFNMGGAGIQTLKKWFHTHEYNERESPDNYQFIHFFPWDNIEWSRSALQRDGFTEYDYYERWTDVERMAYCASQSEWGKNLNSLDDSLRNRDWFGSWESLEGAYFGRVFDRQSTMVDQWQLVQLIKPWDTRWLSQDWGKSHYCCTLWHAQVNISPSQAKQVLGWDIAEPIKAVITYRELIVNELSSPEVGQRVVSATPADERASISRFFLSPDAFGDRDSGLTIADNLSAELVSSGLPRAEPADTDRAGGYTLMYQLLDDSKSHGTKFGQPWLIGVECPKLLESLPVLMRDPKKLDDVLKTDLSVARIEQDVSEAARYGLKSMLSPRGLAPKEVRAHEYWESMSASDVTSKAIKMRIWEQKEAQRGGMLGRRRR